MKKYYSGDACPDCKIGYLETYNDDKANQVVLACVACKAEIARGRQR